MSTPDAEKAIADHLDQDAETEREGRDKQLTHEPELDERIAQAIARPKSEAASPTQEGHLP